MLFYYRFLFKFQKKKIFKLLSFRVFKGLFTKQQKFTNNHFNSLFFTLQQYFSFFFFKSAFLSQSIGSNININPIALGSFYMYSFNINVSNFSFFQLSSLFFNFSKLFTRKGFTGFFFKKFNQEPALFLFMFLFQFIEIYRFPILFYPKRFGKIFYQIPKILAKIPFFFAFYFWRRTNLKLDFQDQVLKNSLKVNSYMDLFFANFDRIIRSFRGRSRRYKKKRFRVFDKNFSKPINNKRFFFSKSK